nr:MAG TPA: hypothetical protein [Bacteriophage sp.]
MLFYPEQRRVEHTHVITLCHHQFEVFDECGSLVFLACALRVLQLLTRQDQSFCEEPADSLLGAGEFHTLLNIAQRGCTPRHSDIAKRFRISTGRYLCRYCAPKSPSGAENDRTWDIADVAAPRRLSNLDLFPLRETEWEFLLRTYSRYNTICS